MNAFRKQTEDQQKAYDSSMRKPLIFSVVFHICVVVIGTLGLPYFVTKPEPREVAITIEMAELDLVSQTDVLAPPTPVKERKEKPEPTKPVEQKKTYSKPEPVEEEEPEIVQKQPDKEVPEPPDVTEKAEKKEIEKEKEPKIKKPPTPRPKPPTPPEKKVEKKKPEEKKKEDSDMESVLKDILQEDTSQPTPITQEPVKNEPSQTPSQIARVTGKLTRSEEDDLNSGVAPCWNVNAGGKDAEKLVVEMQVFVNPDLTVRDVLIVDQLRYSSDSAFKTAAEAARRALLAPNCNKLRLPPEKYEDWKVFTYIFDPSLML